MARRKEGMLITVVIVITATTTTSSSKVNPRIPLARFGDLFESVFIVKRSEEHTSELQSHRDLHSFPTRRSSDLGDRNHGHNNDEFQQGESAHPARSLRRSLRIGIHRQAASSPAGAFGCPAE